MSMITGFMGTTSAMVNITANMLINTTNVTIMMTIAARRKSQIV